MTGHTPAPTPTPQAKRIAFVKIGTIPLASGFVLAEIEKRFPEFEVDVLDISTLIRAQKLLLATNAGITLATYGWDIVRGKRRPKQSFLRTPLLYKAVKRTAKHMIRPGVHAFSLQMQSLFDTSVNGIPNFIYTDHTNLSNLEYTRTPQNSLYPKRWRELEAAIYHNAANVFVRSHNVGRTLVNGYGLPPERVHCVYAGSNAQIDLRPSSASPHHRNAKQILFVGLDWERKGGPILLEAFRRIRPKHPDATLVVVGKAPPLDEPNIILAGTVPIERVHQYYEEASIFCMPTWQEPFGIVFVEAMSHGLPIVATRVGALPDMVEDGRNGYLVEPGDATALAARLDELLSDPDRRQAFGTEGRALAQDRYNWNKVGERLEQHIRRTLANNTTHPEPPPPT